MKKPKPTMTPKPTETQMDIATQRLLWAQQFKIMEVEEMRKQIQSFEPKFNVVNVDEILKLK